MLYDMALWASLILLWIGVIHRIDAWFLRDVGLGDRTASPAQRFGAGLKGLLATVFSGRIVGLLKVVIVDVLFQGRILRDAKDPLAWVMHVCIFWGFLLLLVFHALGSTFGTLIAPSYVSTLNPFMLLRDACGLVLAVGLMLAVVRRLKRRGEIVTSAGDKAVVSILAVIALTGFLLQAVKTTSVGEFTRMATDYTGGALTPDDTEALKAYWVAEYGLVAPVASHDPAMLDKGKAVHESFCQSCHTKLQAAFVSYGVSRVIAPAAAALDGAGLVRGLWWVHVLACCLGLVWVAFSKMFHVVSTPVSLVVAEVAGAAETPAAAATRQMIELDGCSHGGACHESCPVRLRRLERIGGEPAYEPMLAFVGRKSATDLGSRPVAG